MNRTIGVLLLVVIVAVGGLAVASSRSSSDEERKGVTNLKLLAGISTKPMLDKLVAGFNRSHPEIHVAASYAQTQQVGALLSTAVASGNAPDLVYTMPGSILLNSTIPLAEKGLIADLSNRPWAEHVVDAAKEQVSYEGKIYAWPLDFNWVGLVANKPLMAKLGLGIPSTFDELLENCRKSASQGIPYLAGSFNLAAHFPVSVAVSNWVYSEDPEWLQKRAEGHVSFASSPLFRTALQRVVDMKEADCFQKGVDATAPGGMYTLTANGQAVAIITGSAASITTANPDVELQYFPFPGDTAESTFVPGTSVNAISVMDSSPNKEAAMTFVDFLAQEQQSKQWAKLSGNISSYDAQSGTIDAKYDLLKPHIEKQQTTPYLTSQNGWSNGSFTALQEGMLALYLGKKTINQVRADLDTAWDKDNSAG
jgi:raffinose/stachyose/melibiose transport system substrate-binding protein